MTERECLLAGLAGFDDNNEGVGRGRAYRRGIGPRRTHAMPFVITCHVMYFFVFRTVPLLPFAKDTPGRRRRHRLLFVIRIYDLTIDND